MDKQTNPNIDVPISGYFALIFAVFFFSGVVPILAESYGSWLNAFDFTKLAGSFGNIGGNGSLRGSGGAGARDGFIFALTLMPVIMLALGVIQLVDHYHGLSAAQKLLTPLLKPMMGIPGITGLSLIASLQSTDAGAGMTKGLRGEGQITENELTIFGMFQFIGGACITNFLSSGAAIIVLVQDRVPLIVLLSFGVIFAFKILAANCMRLYLIKFGSEA